MASGGEREGQLGLPLLRLETVLARIPLRPAAEPVMLPSDSNEAWSVDDDALGPLVLRICWRGDPERLIREAAVGLLLPAEVGYPEVVDAGRVPGDRDLTWSLTRRLEGMTLAAAWSGLGPGQRRRACAQAAELLRALHGWRPPRSLVPLLIPDHPRPQAGASGIIGRSIHPLPMEHAAALLDHGQALGLASGLVRRLRDYLAGVETLAPRMDDPRLPTVIHSDLSFDNIWWDGGDVAGLLDLEWVRLAPPYVELARLKDNVDAEDLVGVVAHRVLYESLSVDYPALFDVPLLKERIRVVQVDFALRQLVALLPLPPAETVPPDHPLPVLHRLLAD